MPAQLTSRLADQGERSLLSLSGVFRSYPEIGHMISQHRGCCVLSQDEAQSIAPDLAPAAFAHLLERSTGDVEEYEAETIASLIHQRVRVRPQLVIDVVPPAAAQRLTRVEYIFGG